MTEELALCAITFWLVKTQSRDAIKALWLVKTQSRDAIQAPWLVSTQSRDTIQAPWMVGNVDFFTVYCKRNCSLYKTQYWFSGKFSVIELEPPGKRASLWGYFAISRKSGLILKSSFLSDWCFISCWWNFYLPTLEIAFWNLPHCKLTKRHVSARVKYWLSTIRD